MIHRIVKNTKRSATYVTAEKTGKALANLLPKPVELHQMRTPVRRLMILTIELLVGMLVLGAFVLGLFYFRLEKGAIDLDFVVPSIEQAINEQLSDLSVKIDSAFVGKNAHSTGVHFRLRNIVLYNKQGEAIANAPLAAVDLNGQALMWGRIAPSQVVFIQPSLDIVYNEGKGYSLSYASIKASEDVIGDLLNGMGVLPKDGTGAETSPVKGAKIEFMKAVTAAFEEARSHRNTTSYLTQFGVRDATVNYMQGNSKISWKVPDFIVDLKHSENGSVIRGFGQLGFGKKEEKIAPWKLRFQTQQFDDTQDLQLDIGFKQITPASLHHLFPDMAAIKNFQIPLGGKVNAKLNRLGELQSIFANIHLAAGKLTFPWLDKDDKIDGMDLDIAEVKLAYSSKGGKIHILPSLIRWGSNQTNLSGIVVADPSAGAANRWKFSFKGTETRLAAKDFDLGAMIIDEWWVIGTITPDLEHVEISDFFMRAGNATIKINGNITDALSSPGVYLQGKLSSMAVPVLKRLWPRFVALDAREWVGSSIKGGRVAGGEFKIALPPGTLALLPNKGDISPEMVHIKMDLKEIVVDYLPGMVPVKIPDATIKISGRQLSVDVPKGRLHFPGGKPLRVSHGSYTISDLRKKNPVSDLNFRVAGDAKDLLRFINQPALKLSTKTVLAPDGIDGKLKGVVSMNIPLRDDVELKDISLKGNLRLTDMKSGKLFGDVSVEGGTVNIKISEKAVNANGGIVIKGIPVKLDWQYIYGADKQRQPPVRLSTVLNRSSRRKIGLASINDLVKGDIPVIVTVALAGEKAKAVQVRADLTNAVISTTAIGWSKPLGTAAVLQFDVENGKSKYLKLNNFNLVGNKLMAEGDLKFSRKLNRLESFHFPSVSSDLIKDMSLTGKRSGPRSIEVFAKIKQLDGRRLLRRLFFDNSKTALKPNKKLKTTNIDFSAEIERIVGDKGTYISESKLDIRRREGEVNRLKFSGRLNGKSVIAVLMDGKTLGRRVLKAESNDAGSAFRLMGLYPNIQGGLLSLKVDMDRKGAREKSGTLWVKDFDVITSQKVDAELSSSDGFRSEFIGIKPSRKSRGRAKVMRTKMEFKQLKAPFSYGNGQFILHDSYVNGPVIGATLRGKIDFRTERMRLGGTYVPLYGLNSAIGEIPVLSDLLVGRKGEGVFGMTFAIEGSTASPTVIVNPVSLLTPGVFRQIFDFNNSVSTRQFQKSPRARRQRRPKRSSTDFESFQ